MRQLDAQIICSLLLGGLLCAPALAQDKVQETQEQIVSMRQCLALLSQDAANDTSIGDLRERCRQQIDPVESAEQELRSNQSGVINERKALEDVASENPFVLTPHRINYLLPISWRDDTSDFSDSLGVDKEGVDNTEVEFQLSVKVHIARGILGDGTLSGAYTGRSFWQAYNKEYSAPFRETNHEPELILSYTNDWEWLGFRNVGNQLIFNHQSNGRSEPLSRSWNRVMLNFLFEKDRFAMSFRPWYRIPEDREDDDNPDIEHYMGHFEWMGFYQWHDRTLSIMVRNNLRSDSRGAIELGWSFPISSKIKAYVKYFNGYGESLIEYNNSLQSVGIGVLISDWL